jgi:cytochrome c553
MRTFIHTLVPTLAVLGLMLINPTLAADIAAGEKKAGEVCAACHGKDGNSPTDAYPRIAGQHRDYLSKSLREYKSGARKNAIMAGFAATLSKDDIENVSLYFSKQKSELAAKYDDKK